MKVRAIKRRKDKIKGENCPNCDNFGWYIDCNYSSLPWEAEQVQCEFCWTNPNSVYNLGNKNE
jgi:hypothetical protein